MHEQQIITKYNWRCYELFTQTVIGVVRHTLTTLGIEQASDDLSYSVRHSKSAKHKATSIIIVSLFKFTPDKRQQLLRVARHHGR